MKIHVGALLILITVTLAFLSGCTKESSSIDPKESFDKGEEPVAVSDFEPDTSDPLMAKCEQEYYACRANLQADIENLPVTGMHLVDMQKFDDAASADAFFAKYKHDVQTSIGADLFNSEIDEAYEFPIVLLAIEQDGKYIDKIRIAAACASSGRLTYNSEARLLC